MDEKKLGIGPGGGIHARSVLVGRGRIELPQPKARVYSPGLGAFTALDSLAGSAQAPARLNRYLYAAADPATLVDPDGHWYYGIMNMDAPYVGDRLQQLADDYAKVGRKDQADVVSQAVEGRQRIDRAIAKAARTVAKVVRVSGTASGVISTVATTVALACAAAGQIECAAPAEGISLVTGGYATAVSCTTADEVGCKEGLASAAVGVVVGDPELGAQITSARKAVTVGLQFQAHVFAWGADVTATLYGLFDSERAR